VGAMGITGRVEDQQPGKSALKRHQSRAGPKRIANPQTNTGMHQVDQ